MGDIIHLSDKKNNRRKKTLKSKEKLPDAQTVRLWRLSLEIDDLIKNGVVVESLPPEEIAAIIAHRLGTLIACCENSKELAKFCSNIVERMNTNCITGEPA